MHPPVTVVIPGGPGSPNYPTDAFLGLVAPSKRWSRLEANVTAVIVPQITASRFICSICFGQALQHWRACFVGAATGARGHGFRKGHRCCPQPFVWSASLVWRVTSKTSSREICVTYFWNFVTNPYLCFLVLYFGFLLLYWNTLGMYACKCPNNGPNNF